MLIVNDSYTLAAQMPTMAEKANTARVWARYMCGVIPVSLVQETFDRAYARSTHDYPVTPQRMISAWGDMVDEYNEAMRAENALTGKTNCHVCLDTGFTYHRECRPNGRWYDGVKKSTTCCKYWTRRLQNDVGQGRKQL